MADELIDRALYVAVEEGWSVFPVRLEPDPTDPGRMLKKPLIRWGSEASVSETAIEAMPWDRANAIGVACGPSGLCVIDIDPAADKEARQKLERLPPTWGQTTPRGRHLVFRAPRAFAQRNTTSAPYPGVDIRGDGGYIVLYASIQDLPVSDADIAPWPYSKPIGKPKEEPAAVSSIRPNLNLLAPLPRQGERNAWLASSAGKLVALGFSQQDIATLLLPIAENLGISEKECRTTFLKSAADWVAQRQVTQTVDTTCKTLQQLLTEPDDAEPQALPELLPYGLTILAGAPKVGKSWLALQTAHGLATGRAVLGVVPERTGSVGYYAVEESWPQLRHRVRQLPDPNVADIEFYLQLPFGRDGIAYLMESRHTFIFLDTGVRALGAPPEYAEIQKLYGPLQSWAKREQRAVVTTWHTTKTKYDDSGRIVDKGMDAIMGSRGLVAVADAMWLLVEGGMSVEGRDIPKNQLILQQEGNTPWLTQEGSAGLQGRIVDILRRQGGHPLLLEGLVLALGEPKTSVFRAAKTLKEKGILDRMESGGYVLLPSE